MPMYSQTPHIIFITTNIKDFKAFYQLIEVILLSNEYDYVQSSNVPTHLNMQCAQQISSSHIVRFCHVLDYTHTYFDLLYSNSMCRQSSIPTSILMLKNTQSKRNINFIKHLRHDRTLFWPSSTDDLHLFITQH